VFKHKSLPLKGARAVLTQAGTAKATLFCGVSALNRKRSPWSAAWEAARKSPRSLFAQAAPSPLPIPQPRESAAWVAGTDTVRVVRVQGCWSVKVSLFQGARGLKNIFWY